MNCVSHIVHNVTAVSKRLFCHFAPVNFDVSGEMSASVMAAGSMRLRSVGGDVAPLCFRVAAVHR